MKNSLKEKFKTNLKNKVMHSAYTELAKDCIGKYKVWDTVCFALIGAEDTFEENYLFLLDVIDEIGTELKNMIKL